MFGQKLLKSDDPVKMALIAGNSLKRLMSGVRYLLRNSKRGKTDVVTELKGYLDKGPRGSPCKYNSEESPGSHSAEAKDIEPDTLAQARMHVHLESRSVSLALRTLSFSAETFREVMCDWSFTVYVFMSWIRICRASSPLTKSISVKVLAL
jgi:hypothetical protein